MIKTPQKLLLAATLITVLNFQSCKKYEDGPAFTLKSKKSRLVREWEVVKIYDPVGQQTYPYDTWESTIIYEFEKDGDFTIDGVYSYAGYTFTDSYKGDWEFSSDKEEIEIEIDGYTEDWEIKRLTKDEFWFEDEDGYEWELEAK